VLILKEFAVYVVAAGVVEMKLAGLPIVGGLRRGGGGLGSLSRTGLKTGHYMLNEFDARGRQRSVRRWGRLLSGG